jgi:hypothetical protein
MLGLIKFLEDVMLQSQEPLPALIKWVSADYHRTLALKQEIDRFHQERVTPLLCDMKLIEL